MFWGKGPDKPQPPKEAAEKVKDAADEVKTAARDVQKAAKDFDPKLPERHKLPKSLQEIVDKEDKDENFYNELVDG